MRKTYKMKNLECANCASKMERSIAKIEGVNEVSINFMMQKMVLDIESEDILDKIVSAVKKIEPDCTVEI